MRIVLINTFVWCVG